MGWSRWGSKEKFGEEGAELDGREEGKRSSKQTKSEEETSGKQKHISEKEKKKPSRWGGATVESKEKGGLERIKSSF